VKRWSQGMVEVAHWEKSRVRWDGRGMRRVLDGRAWEGGVFGAGGGTRKVTGIPRVEVRRVRTRGRMKWTRAWLVGSRKPRPEPADGWEFAACLGGEIA
jgi:hypothetical protein